MIVVVSGSIWFLVDIIALRAILEPILSCLAINPQWCNLENKNGKYNLNVFCKGQCMMPTLYQKSTKLANFECTRLYREQTVL